MAMPILPPGTNLYDVPAGPAPPGLTSNLVDPPSNAAIASVTLSLFLVIAGLMVVLRLYVRLFIHRSPGLDDLAIAAALPMQIALSGITIWLCTSGAISHHTWDTRLGLLVYDLPYYTTVLAVLPQVTTFLIKFSILWMFYRLFSPSKPIRYAIWVGIGICAIMYTVWFFVFIFVAALTDIVGDRLSVAQSAFNVVTDLYLLVLPMVAISQLHMARNKKFSIASIFLIGAFACALSIVNLYYRTQYTGPTTDFTWLATNRVMFSSLELDIGIIVACMPMIPQLFAKSKKVGLFTSLRSGLSNLLRSRDTGAQSSGNERSKDTYKNVDGSHVELGIRKHSNGSAPSSGNGPFTGPADSNASRDQTRREWFESEHSRV